jgi:magnesium transporter
VIVDMALYQDGVRRPGEVDLGQMYEGCRAPECFAWIGLFEPTEEEFDSVRREFDLHELAVEDALEAHQRPKLEVYGKSLFIVLKAAKYDPHEQVVVGEVQIFLGEEFIITVRHGEVELHEVRLELEQRPEFLRLGPGAALHAIIDRVADDYGPVVEELDRDVGELEAEVFSESRADATQRIYGLKREVLDLYNAVAPLVEPVERLERSDFPVIRHELRPYFRDVRDHLIRYMRDIDGSRELLTSILAANLTQASVRQNEDVRKISAWAAIIAVPTLITGIYGMNFEHMPELGWRVGYPLAVAVMALACILLYRNFKRAGWL